MIVFDRSLALRVVLVELRSVVVSLMTHGDVLYAHFVFFLLQAPPHDHAKYHYSDEDVVDWMGKDYRLGVLEIFDYY